MSNRIKIIMATLLVLLLFVSICSYHSCQKYKNDLQRSKVGMMNMTIEVMNNEIERAEKNNYSDWDENIGRFDFMLSNLEYSDSKELGDYDAIYALIEKVSLMQSPSEEEREKLHAIKAIKYTRTVNNKEAKIMFCRPEDGDIL